MSVTLSGHVWRLCCCNRLLNQSHQLQFTCRVIHSIPLLMSSVQVFHTDRMVAMSHLIGSDQLPTLKMVSAAGVILRFYVHKYLTDSHAYRDTNPTLLIENYESKRRQLRRACYRILAA